MKSFKQFIKEETMPYAATASGSVNIDEPDVLDGLNTLLTGVTAKKFVTPYIAYERVQKVLANFAIFPPRPSFFQGESGVYSYPINQFGDKFGQRNDGSFVRDGETLKDETHGDHEEGEDNLIIDKPKSEIDDEYSLFFEWRKSDCGMFEVFAEIVTKDDLEDILSDIEDEMNDEEDEELNEQKYTNRATNERPTVDNTPMKDRATISGASTPVPSGSFEPRVPTKSTKDLDKMNRDNDGNTVVESDHTNKDKKKEVLKKLFNTKRVKDARQKMKGKVQSTFDPRDLKKVAENVDTVNRVADELKKMTQQSLTPPASGNKPIKLPHVNDGLTGKTNQFRIDEEKINRILEACWKGYRKEGMKTMFGKKYPNCVKVKSKK
jgi:hypothetical protein